VIQCSTAIIGLLFALAGALGNQKHSKIQGEKFRFLTRGVCSAAWRSSRSCSIVFPKAAITARSKAFGSLTAIGIFLLNTFPPLPHIVLLVHSFFSPSLFRGQHNRRYGRNRLAMPISNRSIPGAARTLKSCLAILTR
jgi:hypothetical protein